MTEEKRLWDEVLARLPRPFRDSSGGKYGEAGRTVAGVDYGVMRDEDVIAPAVSFLRFEV